LTGVTEIYNQAKTEGVIYCPNNITIYSQFSRA